MRDPYEILRVKRGATLDEIKAAYRRACKERHPDLGGSHEAMVELNTAYAFILNELKHGYQQQQQQEQARQKAGEDAWQDVGEATRDDKRDNRWRDIYRDIDEELETMRRAAEQYDEQLRTMRRAAWQTGHHADWAKLTWDDFAGFLTRTARSGVKGLALIFAALVGVGTVLIEANFISALILLGGALGFAFSLAMKSDKGGVLSAALLLVRRDDDLASARAQCAVPVSAGHDQRPCPARADFQVRSGRRNSGADDGRCPRHLHHHYHSRRYRAATASCTHSGP